MAAPSGAVRPRTRAEIESEQARAAWVLGRAALDEGRLDVALRALERAARIASSDPTPRLSWATACLAAGQYDGAARLFDEVAAATDTQAAWLGAAAAHLGAGRVDRATAALIQALQRHAIGAGFGGAALADAVVRQSGAPGWCGLDGLGALRLGAVADPSRLRVVADGRVVAPDAPLPSATRSLHVRLGPWDLLGSPIDVAALRRLEGAVWPATGGITGWAWYPGDVERTPRLRLAAAGRTWSILAEDLSVEASKPLAQPRGFTLSRRRLAKLSPGTLLDVRDELGAVLAGSPLRLDPPRPLTGREQDAASFAHVARAAASRWPARGAADLSQDHLAWSAMPCQPATTPRQAPRRPRRAVSVVVPVYRGMAETLACLSDVFRTVPDGTRVIVVDDASPEPELPAALDRLAARGRISLVRHDRNRGYPVSANAGLRAALRGGDTRDVVLLNSDTRLPAGWLQALRAAVHASGDIGSATPLSNDATIASYPDAAGGNPPPSAAALRRLQRFATTLGMAPVTVPTGVGFCLYLRHECLIETGVLREDAFAQGYGEENDLCARAEHLGWRHVVVPNAFVAHVGGRSFGATRAALMARNSALIEALHPGYAARIAAWIAADTLAPARHALDLRRWRVLARARRREFPHGAALIVTHDSGGGVERVVRQRVARLRESGRWPVLLRPVIDRGVTDAATERRYRPGLVRLDDGLAEGGFPNLQFAVGPTGMSALAGALRMTRPMHAEIHHMLGHDHALLATLRDFGITPEFRLHDYAAICARITLTGGDARYCGEPDVTGCNACVAAHGSRLEETITPAALRARSAADLRAARRVVVPSHDMAARIARHFPGVRAVVRPHETEPSVPLRPGGTMRVLVLGAIGPEKGFDVLLDCARDAARRGLALSFVVVGHTSDDQSLLDTGRVDITGPYQQDEVTRLIKREDARAGFLPSTCPETWCFTLGEMFRAGLPVAVFDLGAQAERVRRTGRGWVLPLGAPASLINNQFLAPRPLAAIVNVMHRIAAEGAANLPDAFTAPA